MIYSRIAGVVLAGGRSSRMGMNKAMLSFRGSPLVDHMRQILQGAGIEDIFIGGDVEGYDHIPDATRYAGPAQAIWNIMEALPAYDYFLVVPVDMPLLNSALITPLLKSPCGAYWQNYPLPAFLRRGVAIWHCNSVRDIHQTLGSKKMPLLQDDLLMMRNINTPSDWEAMVSHEY
ncbi:MAG: molybdenum cofactor guanylyltransferase [Pseudobdellovibrionaceae bacterium]